MLKKCNCENCVCEYVSTESVLMTITDNMGREIFWEDMGRKDD
jgi:hypothetical protein